MRKALDMRRLRGSCEQRQAQPGTRQAHRHRHRQLHRSGRCRTSRGLRHPRAEDVRFGRAAGPPDRQGRSSSWASSPGPGHETTFAQIVAEELGIPADDIKVVEGDTDNTPYGLGTYASRSTPVAGAATAGVPQAAEKAASIAAHLLEAAEGPGDGSRASSV